MQLAFAAFALAPGLAIGSFLNVVAARVPLRQSVAAGRSVCMSCGSEIAWYDNVPLVSYALLRGRCRSCGAGIGARYFAVELLTGVLIAGCVLRFGLTWDAAIGAFYCAVLVAISAIDIEHRIVPNRIVLPAAAVVLVARTLVDPSVEWLVAGLGASLFLFVAALAYPKGMGMGDVKLALAARLRRRAHRPGGVDGRDACGARAERRALRPPRLRRAEDGDPVRALPRLRRDRGALRGRPPARRLPVAPQLAGAQASLEGGIAAGVGAGRGNPIPPNHDGARCRYPVRGI